MLSVMRNTGLIKETYVTSLAIEFLDGYPPELRSVPFGR